MAGGLFRCTLPAASWGIKRQRTEGRRPSPPPSAFVNQDEEDCILGLLILSTGPFVLGGGIPPPLASKQQLMLPPRSVTPPAEAQEQEAPCPISFPGLMLLLPPPPPEQKQSLFSSPEMKQRQRLQQQNETLPPPMPSTADLPRYKCPECRKAFSSYQALGGHKSSHRKRPAPSRKKQRHVKARRAMAMLPTSLTECSPKKGLGIDLN